MLICWRNLPRLRYIQTQTPSSPHLFDADQLQVVYGEDGAGDGNPAQQVSGQEQQHQRTVVPLPEGVRGIGQPGVVNHLMAGEYSGGGVQGYNL